MSSYRFAPGDKAIPAAFLNAVSRHIESPMDRTGKSVPVSSQPSTILVKNVSGSALPDLGVAGIHDIVISPSDNEDDFREAPLLEVTTPVTADHATRFVILRHPLGLDDIGEAIASGVCVARIDVTNETHTCATVKNSDTTQLASTDSGLARILWKEAGIGTKWAVIALGGAGGGSGSCVMPFNLTFTGEHAELARSNTYMHLGESVHWHRDNPPSSTDGIIITIQVGEAYREDGDATLYAYYINFVFDSVGMLVKLLPERRVVVDTPVENCS